MNRLGRHALRFSLLVLLASVPRCSCGNSYPIANSGAALQPDAVDIRLSAQLFPYINQNLESILRANFPLDATGQYIMIYLPEASDSSADEFCDELGQWPGQVPACSYSTRIRDGCIGPGDQDANGVCQPELGHPRETYRSYLSIKVQDLVNHFNLFMEPPSTDSSGGFRLQIVDVPVNLSLGLYVNASKLAGVAGLGYFACLFETTPGQAASVNIHELDISIEPTVVDQGGTPTLFATSVVRNLDLENLALSAAPLTDDQACNGTGSGVACSDVCNVAEDVLKVGDEVYNAINDFIQPAMPELATPIADIALGFLWNKPLQFGGAIPTQSISVVPPGVGTDLQILASTEDGAFSVTQPDPNDDTTLGMDLPMQAGAYATPSSCAPYVPPNPPYSSGLPAFTGSIQVNNADGTPVTESYHLAMSISESYLNQLAYAARSSGLLCLTVGSNEDGLLSTGSFVPTAGLLFLIAPQFSTLATSDAPIFFRLSPGDAPIVQLGDPNQPGTDDEGNPITPSMINIRLNNLGIEAHMFTYDRYIRVLQLTLDLNVGLTMHATSDGQVNLSLDHVVADNVTNAFNPILPGIQLQAITKVVFQLVGQVLGSSGLTFDLPINTELQKSLGTDLQLRIMDIRRDGPDNGVIAAYVRVCSPTDIADPTNPTCYSGATPTRDPLTATLAADPGLYTPTLDAQVIALNANAVPSGHARLQISGANKVQVAVDGPLWGPVISVDANGIAVVSDPRLQILGHHLLQVRSVDWRGTVDTTHAAVQVNVLVDPARPTLSLENGELTATDLVTPEEKMTFKVGDQDGLTWTAAQALVKGAKTGTLAIARDEAGNESAPVTLGLGAETSAPVARGCQQSGEANFILIAFALCFLRLRKCNRHSLPRHSKRPR